MLNETTRSTSSMRTEPVLVSMVVGAYRTAKRTSRFGSMVVGGLGREVAHQVQSTFLLLDPRSPGESV